MIPESTIEKIKSIARIEDFISDTQKGYGQNKLFTNCPACLHWEPKKKQGLQIDTSKQLAKCFKCQVSYTGAIDFIIKTKGLTYPDALKHIAAHYSIFIDETPGTDARSGVSTNKSKPQKATPALKPVPAAGKKEKEEKTGTDARSGVYPTTESFCDRQLKESGLCYDDIRIETTETDGTIRFVSPFIKGTRDQYGQILEGKGDDVLIKYYDLDAKPVVYKQEKTNLFKPLIRARWQNPAAHLDKSGDPIKYQSPAGSGSHIYIPEKIRVKYRRALPIDRLYIQEGEKKAEKACKHGIWSIGIMGINNLGEKGRLPDEIQLIIQRCEVKEVIFLLDSDWLNLSEKLKNGEPVDTRPRQFFFAVKSYKEYLRTLSTMGCPVEIYFSHIIKNEKDEKGIDDLLTGTLAGTETKLLDDFNFAVNAKNGTGTYIQVHKITMDPDDRIADYWYLNDAEKFADFHYQRLKELKEFKIKGHLRRFDENRKLIMAQQLFKEEQFWQENIKADKDGKETTTLIFDYVNAMNFLQRRGFFRVEMKSSEIILVQIEKRVIKVIQHTSIKDFTKEFCREIKRLDVLNLLMRGGAQYLGPEKLHNLDLFKPNIERAAPDKQNLYFRNKIWEVTADGIKELNYGQFTGHVWGEKIIDFEPTICTDFLKVTVLTDELKEKIGPEYKGIDNGNFFIDYSDDAQNSHFLRFLINASNFYWRKTKGIQDEEITLYEMFINAKHLINKLTCIGYLLHEYKDDSELKAVVGMDGKLTEVGASNGRSGKSLLGVAISQIVPQVVIDGKNKKIEDDNFRFHEVTEKTKSLFFDDVRVTFDFESLFQNITGSITVNQKSGLRFTLRKEESPKILITTNHAIKGTGSSFDDRQALMSFSDYYNEKHKPIDDFGFNFFSEWGNEQWNLFYNLMAYCLILFFKSKENGWSGVRKLGIVPPPMENLKLRKLRQTMGENFLTWADAYFDWDEGLQTGNLNTKHVRKDLFDNFLNECQNERKYTTATSFKEKIVAYCQYSNYDFNPHKRNDQGLDRNEYYRIYPENDSFIGGIDKAGGKEYFMISTK